MFNLNQVVKHPEIMLTVIVQCFQSWCGAIGQVSICGVGGFLPRQLHFPRFYRHGDSRYSSPGVEGQVVRHDPGK